MPLSRYVSKYLSILSVETLNKKSYPKAVPESGRFFVDSRDVNAEAVFDASTNHEAKIVVHNQLKGHLNEMQKVRPASKST